MPIECGHQLTGAVHNNGLPGSNPADSLAFAAFPPRCASPRYTPSVERPRTPYYGDVVKLFCPADITLFADDTALVSSAATTLSLIEHLQSQLTQIDTHLRKLKMELNSGKTLYMMFRQNSYSNSSVTLRLRGEHVKQCSSFKYLGVHIDSDLSWKTHASKLICKIQKMMYVLHRSSGSSNRARRRVLFRAYIYPHFLYGICTVIHVLFCCIAGQTRGTLSTLLHTSNL